jgi:hypothetical protein
MKILVRFAGDNDFSAVVRAFGDIMVMRSHREWERTFLTKERIAQWFNNIAPTLYFMAQNRGRYANRPYDEEVEFMGEYLQILPGDVYIGSEVDAQMAHWASWGNGDSVLVDLDTGNVTVV